MGWGALGHVAYLHTGDRVYTADSSGRRSTWTVRSVKAYAKSVLPQSVFTSTADGGPTLRLVSCGGTLLRSGPHAGHYNDNVVVTLTPED